MAEGFRPVRDSMAVEPEKEHPVLKARFFQLQRALALLLVLFVAAPAMGQSPSGQWEMSISGQVRGVKAIGVAFLSFHDDGSVDGYAHVRGGSSLLSIDGTWSGTGRSIAGTLDVISELFGDRGYEFVGVVRAGRSIALRCTNEFGDSMKVSGRPIKPMADRSGAFSGTFSAAGAGGTMLLGVDPSPQPGLYEISGVIIVDGVESEVAGHATVNSRGVSWQTSRTSPRPISRFLACGAHSAPQDGSRESV